MATEIKWIKVSTNLFNDEKIKLIRSMPDGSTVILVWLQLLLLAGRINQDGMLILSNVEIPYTEEMMATQFDVPLNTVLIALDAFKRFGMVEIIDDVYHITNWAKYQAPDDMERIRERDKERKREARAKVKALALTPAEPTKALPAPKPEETPMQRRFKRFWAAYPRKVGKGAAEKSFAKYKPDDALTDTMISAVEAQKRTQAWQEGYIPNPATWLNQRRWEDEISDQETEVVLIRSDLEDWGYA